MKKVIAIFMALAILIVTLGGCDYNYDIVDTVYSFDRAIIEIGDRTIEVEVKSWTDFPDSDQLQITAPDGTVYLTDSTRCVLIKEATND